MDLPQNSLRATNSTSILQQPKLNAKVSQGDATQTRSPAVDVFTNLINKAKGNDITNAILNSLTICFVILLIGTLVAVYFVLEPFLRPLLWALLIGSALFPFKHRLTRVTKAWLQDIRRCNNSVTIQSATLPFKVANWIIDGIIDIMVDYARLLAVIFVTLLTIHLSMFYFSFTHKIFQASVACLLQVTYLIAFLQSSSNSFVIFSLAFTHLTLVAFAWRPETKRYLVTLSPIIWICVLLQLTSIFGTLGAIIAFSCVLLILIGIMSSLFDSRSTINTSTIPSTDSTVTPDECDAHDIETIEFINSLIQSLLRTIWTYLCFLIPTHRFTYSRAYSSSPDHSCDFDELDSHETLEMSTQTGHILESSRRHSVDSNRDRAFASVATSPVTHLDTFSSPSVINEKGPSILAQEKMDVHVSNAYIYALLWTCILAHIWSNPQILILLPIPLSIMSLRWLFSHFTFPIHMQIILDQLNSWLDSRRDAIFHPFMRTTYRYLILGDSMIAASLEKSLDTLCSLFVILMVIVSLLLAAIFLAFQIYGESIHLVNVFGNIVNATLESHPEFISLFSTYDSSENSTSSGNITLFNEIISNAYFHGRKWLKKTVRAVLNVANESDEGALNASLVIEKKLLEVWDKSYHMWLTRDNISAEHIIQSGLMKSKHLASASTSNASELTWNTLIDAFKTLDFSQCFNLFKENLDTVMSVLESIWIVLKGNVSLIFSLITGICSLLLSGSSALLNGALNFVVFSTSLFYLLCASDDTYKPIEWASNLFPSGSSQSANSTQSMAAHWYRISRRKNNKFIRAFNEGINSVFEASFKMTTFYGLYTWLIHTIFQAKLIYIPSVTAALLGAVPFFGCYWASLPAVLELWLIHGCPWKALLMAVIALAPTYVVDSAIYAEIKGGGHPYLTGLAIAGGVFFLGFEGAIFGPILLCCLFVGINIYTSFMETTSYNTSSPSRPAINPRLRQLKRVD